MAEGSNKRGYLEEILVQLPGFKGYLARENRRDSDQACREHLASRLSAAKKAVGDAKRKRLSAGKLEGLEQLDRVGDRLEKLVSRVAHAERGYSGFFDRQQIGPEELDRLKDADLALTDHALVIEQKLSGLAAAAAGAEMEEAIQAALDAIDRFEQDFDQRKHVMTEVI
ncbi:MAG: hypothetical protein HY814_14355 [Candidatus Riflebacteria bacterium]|nr:hypothetical protein [Candidatus Riflebacteria bacterium]